MLYLFRANRRLHRRCFVHHPEMADLVEMVRLPTGDPQRECRSKMSFVTQTNFVDRMSFVGQMNWGYWGYWGYWGLRV